MSGLSAVRLLRVPLPAATSSTDPRENGAWIHRPVHQLRLYRGQRPQHPDQLALPLGEGRGMARLCRREGDLRAGQCARPGGAQGARTEAERVDEDGRSADVAANQDDDSDEFCPRPRSEQGRGDDCTGRATGPGFLRPLRRPVSAHSSFLGVRIRLSSCPGSSRTFSGGLIRLVVRSARRRARRAGCPRWRSEPDLAHGWDRSAHCRLVQAGGPGGRWRRDRARGGGRASGVKGGDAEEVASGFSLFSRGDDFVLPSCHDYSYFSFWLGGGGPGPPGDSDRRGRDCLEVVSVFCSGADGGPSASLVVYCMEHISASAPHSHCCKWR